MNLAQFGSKHSVGGVCCVNRARLQELKAVGKFDVRRVAQDIVEIMI